jgi:ABC-type branched-subunit amino acid transport system ATPase component
MTAVLGWRDLTARYAGVAALEAIDLELAAGEILAVLGTNGAGKSSLARAAAGLLVPASGAVVLFGVDVTRRAPSERVTLGLSVVLSGGGFDALTVEEALLVAARARGYTRVGARADVRAALGELDELERRKGIRVQVLSQGERRLLALMQGLIQRPRALVVDELSMSLSPSLLTRARERLLRARAEGCAVTVIDQSAELALGMADRACFLEAGRLRYVGTPEGLAGRRDLLRPVFLGGTAAVGAPPA